MNHASSGTDAALVQDAESGTGGAALQASAASAINTWVGERLHEMAALLDVQGGNPYRAAAYRKAAGIVAGLTEDLRSLFAREGAAGIDALPAIGSGITSAIVEMLTSGRWNRLERLRGDMDPDALFRTIPGVGARLARRLHEALGVDSLEALEAAAHDGRLARVTRLGARRAAAISAALTQMLDRRRVPRRPRWVAVGAHEAPVEDLLDVDREYRDAAKADKLPRIAPRRFNPEGKAWLPVLHTARGDWHCTVLFSNTARAHELGRVHDWVVIYADDPDHNERQYTVVTPPGGPLAGRRVVRGREAECQALYRGPLCGFASCQRTAASGAYAEPIAGPLCAGAR